VVGNGKNHKNERKFLYHYGASDTSGLQNSQRNLRGLIITELSSEKLRKNINVSGRNINIIHYKILLFLQNYQTADNKKQIS